MKQLRPPRLVRRQLRSLCAAMASFALLAAMVLWPTTASAVSCTSSMRVTYNTYYLIVGFNVDNFSTSSSITAVSTSVIFPGTNAVNETDTWSVEYDSFPPNFTWVFLYQKYAYPGSAHFQVGWCT
jgi:hypothetical protein